MPAESSGKFVWHVFDEDLNLVVICDWTIMSSWFPKSWYNWVDGSWDGQKLHYCQSKSGKLYRWKMVEV